MKFEKHCKIIYLKPIFQIGCPMPDYCWIASLYSILFCFCLTPSYTQGLLLGLNSEITPGGDYGIRYRTISGSGAHKCLVLCTIWVKAFILYLFIEFSYILHLQWQLLEQKVFDCHSLLDTPGSECLIYINTHMYTYTNIYITYRHNIFLFSSYFRMGFSLA